MAEEDRQRRWRRRRFANLRSVRWRIDLGILPASPGASVDELRRAAADSRRRYVSLRRRLMVDPHLPKEEDRSSNLVVDNPLSQNPDSSWGRFFRGAELEKTVDQDLSRLYPEDGSYFQTPSCQAMLRRILLMWCLQHPECGYRQGMHELLAPLVYVLQVDIDKLSQVRKLHEDCFNDDFDGVAFPDTDMLFSYKPRKDSNWHSRADNGDDSESASRVNTLDELDLDTKEIISLSDAYGAEGELGIVLSERFMEHDAYSMFDGLMDGGSGVVCMAEFFSTSKVGSSSSLAPVIEASASLFHLLSIVEPSLHIHFIELDVEPQYFALRWLRVLFGREFCLDDLLVVWDEVFACSNDMLLRENEECNFKILCSSRGAFIAAMAVSMILHLRSSLLATEINTLCLQRLLNFPNNVDVHKLIEKAKSLQSTAIDVNTLSPSLLSKKDSCDYDRVYSNLATSTPPRTPLHPLAESYWEEQWRNLHNDGTALKESDNKGLSYKRSLKQSLSQRLGLSRTESDPSPVKVVSVNNDAKNSVRRCLLNSYSDKVVQSNEVIGKFEQDKFPIVSIHKETILSSERSSQLKLKAASENLTVSPPPSVAKFNPLIDSPVKPADESSAKRTEDCSSGENSPVFYTARAGNEHDNCHDNDSEKSSITSNSCAGDDYRDEVLPDESSSCNCEDKTVSEAIESGANVGQARPLEKTMVPNERKPFINKLQWLLRFGRPSAEGNVVEKGSAQASSDDKHDVVPPCPSPADASSDNSCSGINLAYGDNKKVMGTLKNIGQNMLENIQVIETAFQQDRAQPSAMENLSNNILGGKGQVTAMAALTELRKISNLLREM
ncbi:TBC1 domain family member 5 A [Zea mays]|uniref:TBC1 domain family member 5 A n=1 Tax=Zea mays TaxID=4577 RepID=A0A317Y6H6_MAIZE|nr:TBC1 domain family member 5 A [Zea mays]